MVFVSRFSLALSFLLLTTHLFAAPAPLQSVAESSQWLRTGRYDEVEAIGRALQQRYPKQFHLSSMGTTPEGRTMWVYVLGTGGKFEPKVAREKRETVLIQGGIHAGEIDGKDASFLLLREILEGKTLPQLLQKINLVVVPVFNVDGHERFKTNNRPNQIGPEETGWRTTGLNHNLNRDYLKAEAPEMQAMLRLMNAWDPILAIDLHVTDGAKFQHDIAVMVEPASRGPTALQKAARDLSDKVMADLGRDGHKPLWFYPSFREEDKPASGFSVGPQSPRFSNGYWGLRNRLGVLVETHSWRTYAERVRSTYHSLISMLSAAQSSAHSWRTAAREADSLHQSLANQTVTLRYKNGEKADAIDFQGYAYTREPSLISGQPMIRYDTSKPVTTQLPIYVELESDIRVQAPQAGYLIPPAYSTIWAPKLQLHGISFSKLKKTLTAKGSHFRVEKVELSPQSYEGRQRADVKGAWEPADIVGDKGALWVPIAQQNAMALLQLIEPTSSESLLSWGFMNQIFERKEYMEDYVAEEAAREMLKDPAIKTAFDEALKDSEFASSAAKRLDFFYRRHPSFDERWYVYPIARLDRAPQ